MNQRNRLATARVGTTQVGSYVYDALERLAIRTTSNVSPAGTTHFAYDLSGKVLIEANGSNGATVREYVWFDDMPLAIVANVDTASPQLLHVHADHLDRPIMLANGSKANVWEAVYRPFSEVHAITGTATQNRENRRTTTSSTADVRSVRYWAQSGSAQCPLVGKHSLIRSRRRQWRRLPGWQLAVHEVQELPSQQPQISAAIGMAMSMVGSERRQWGWLTRRPHGRDSPLCAQHSTWSRAQLMA